MIFACSVEPNLTATSVIWSLRYYTHFFLAQQNGHTFPYKKILVNLVTRSYGQPPHLSHFKIPNSRISYNFTPLINTATMVATCSNACDMSILLTLLVL